ncbi:MAG TPA: adenine phosphoribosyltransferase [Firmicutes bacterium]|nr:adenine phosphoribosyltransferase [Bacillota bacterium]
MNLYDKIRDIPDFPHEGIIFRDITPLLQDAAALKQAIDTLKEKLEPYDFDIIVAPEARGFILGAPLAYSLGKGFVPARKPGKLPGKTRRMTYELEYGTDALEIHADAIAPGQRVLVLDDLLATGGTIISTIKLVEAEGGEVVATAFLIELLDLNGRELLEKYPVISLLQY